MLLRTAVAAATVVRVLFERPATRLLQRAVKSIISPPMQVEAAR
jgi:hypothetical protein